MEIDCQSVHEKRQAGDEFLFIDCREQDEHAVASIEGATLLPMSEIQERVSELEPYKKRPIVVFCHHGGRSLQVAMWLSQQGYSDITSMAGGIDLWSRTIDANIPRY